MGVACEDLGAQMDSCRRWARLLVRGLTLLDQVPAEFPHSQEEVALVVAHGLDWIPTTMSLCLLAQ